MLWTELLTPSPNSDMEVLTLSNSRGDLFGERTFKDIIRETEVVRVGSSPI